MLWPLLVWLRSSRKLPIELVVDCFASAVLASLLAWYSKAQPIESRPSVTTSNNDLPARFARLIERAVKDSGKSYSETARLAGIKRDSLRRSLSGGRPVTLAKVVMILDASDFAGEETLLLLMLVGENFALARSGTGAAQFLGEFFKRAPLEIVAQLGENIDELRPRWANGTAKLLARTLAQHIADLNRRGDAIGERFATTIGA